LSEFDLSEAVETDRKVEASFSDEDAKVVLGKTFWACIDGEIPAFAEQDEMLLRSVFNPKMSDRREDGDAFVPPDTDAAYVQRLRELVDEEDAVREKRIAHFLSTSFIEGNAGEMFPSSWTDKVGLLSDDASATSANLYAREDFLDEAAALRNIIASAAKPAFEQSTEDGTAFRIYKKGSIEVRTIQEHDGEETIGMVFSIRA
jgi:hypothetical protein